MPPNATASAGKTCSHPPCICGENKSRQAGAQSSHVPGWSPERCLTRHVPAPGEQRAPGTPHVPLITAGCPRPLHPGSNYLCQGQCAPLTASRKQGKDALLYILKLEEWKYMLSLKILLKIWNWSKCFRLEQLRGTKRSLSNRLGTQSGTMGLRFKTQPRTEFLQFLENMSAGLMHFFIHYYYLP